MAWRCDVAPEMLDPDGVGQADKQRQEEHRPTRLRRVGGPPQTDATAANEHGCRPRQQEGLSKSGLDTQQCAGGGEQRSVSDRARSTREAPEQRAAALTSLEPRVGCQKRIYNKA